MKKIILLLSLSLFCFISAETVKNTNIKKEKVIEMQKIQAPGFFRFMVGNYEITSIYDGYSNMKSTAFIGQDKEKSEELLKKEFAHTAVNNGDFTVKLSVNTFLVNNGKELILIDTGGGKSLGPTMGLSINNIISSGYKVEDITKILLTHLHPDHISGLTIDGKMAYPNATIYVNKKESEYWLSEKNYTKEMKNALDPYIKNKQYKVFENGAELSTGIKSISLPGHTIGHTGYEVTSNNEKVLFWGDITSGYEIQFPYPEIAFVYDYDKNQAKETRIALMKKVSTEKTLVGGSHLPFPGIGHIVENGAGYRWIPFQYIPVE